MDTVLSLITDAFNDAGIFGVGDIIEADDANKAFRTLNALLAMWGQEGLIVPYLTVETIVLDTAKSTYTWGLGEDIDSLAPIRIVSASVLVVNSQYRLVETDLGSLANLSWFGGPGNPTYFVYDRQPVPVLRLDTTPVVGSLRVVSEKPVTPLIELVEQLTFPPEYELFLVKNLAVALCSAYERQPTPLLVAEAGSYKHTIMNRNFKVPQLVPEHAGSYRRGRGTVLAR